jgi:hypothetical protein
MKFNIAFSFLLTLLTCASVSHADLVWSEDFEAAELGDTPQTLGGPWGGPGANSYPVVDGEVPFGPDNQWLRLQAFGIPWTFVNNVQEPTTVSTISFDIYADSEAILDGFVRLAASRETKNSGFVDINADDGLLFPDDLPLDTALRFDIITNISGDSVSANNGETIEDGEIQVFVDGEHTLTKLVRDDGFGDSDGFGLWINNGQTEDEPVDSFFMDNFEYHDMAFVFDGSVDPPGCVPSEGDIDGNGTVEFADFLALSANFGTGSTAAEGDIDCNGAVEFADFLVLSANFGQTVGAAPVPEPNGSLLALIGGIAICSLRRRRS